MKIITWNVNGLRACIKKGFTDWLKNCKADIVCLQETRVREDQIDDSVFDGWHTNWSVAERPGYSGTLTLTREKPDSVSRELGEDRFDNEGRFNEVKIGKLTVMNNYFPNGGQDNKRVPFKLDYYDLLLQKMKKMMKGKEQFVLTGDFNTSHRPIDLARPKQNEKNTGFLPEEREWIDKYLDSGLVDTFREEFPEKEDCYTYWSQRGGARARNVGWRLDYFLVPEYCKSKTEKNKIHSDVEGSDHCPVSIQWKD